MAEIVYKFGGLDWQKNQNPIFPVEVMDEISVLANKIAAKAGWFISRIEIGASVLPINKVIPPTPEITRSLDFTFTFAFNEATKFQRWVRVLSNGAWGVFDAPPNPIDSEFYSNLRKSDFDHEHERGHDWTHDMHCLEIILHKAFKETLERVKRDIALAINTLKPESTDYYYQ